MWRKHATRSLRICISIDYHITKGNTLNHRARASRGAETPKIRASRGAQTLKIRALRCAHTLKIRALRRAPGSKTLQNSIFNL